MAAIAELYKLTPSELRMLRAVLEIGGVRAIADALGISQATVKTHLHHLFQKTGTKGQLDLVKLVASHATPMAGSESARLGGGVAKTRVASGGAKTGGTRTDGSKTRSPDKEDR
jgi:DNA-binding CsgD family transcriptional regulator